MILQNVVRVTQEQSVLLHVLIRCLEKIVKAFVTVQFRIVTLCLGALTVCTNLLCEKKSLGVSLDVSFRVRTCAST